MRLNCEQFRCKWDIKREKLYRNRSPSQAPDRKHCEFTNFRKHDMIRRSGGRGEERVRKSAEKGKKDRLIAGYVWRCQDRWPKMSSFSTGMSWYCRRVHGNEPQTGFINNVHFVLASLFLQNQLSIIWVYACVEILHITGHLISVTLSFDDFSVVSQFYGCLLAKFLCASW